MCINIRVVFSESQISYILRLFSVSLSWPLRWWIWFVLASVGILWK